MQTTFTFLHTRGGGGMGGEKPPQQVRAEKFKVCETIIAMTMLYMIHILSRFLLNSIRYEISDNQSDNKHPIQSRD